MCKSVYVHIYVCVCVCVCVGDSTVVSDVHLTLSSSDNCCFMTVSISHHYFIVTHVPYSTVHRNNPRGRYDLR